MSSAGGGHGFNFLQQIPGVDQIPIHIATSALVGIILISTTFVARSQLVSRMRGADGGLVPEPKLTFRNFFEIVAENLYKLTEMILGKHDAPRYFPLIGSLFSYILGANLLGLIPGFAATTDNLNSTLGCGIFVFLYYNWQGIKTHKHKYIKQFMGPLLWLSPMLFCVEVVSHLIRPFSLGLRLQLNISADHMVLGIFSGLVPYVVPIVFYGLGLFVSFVQAFVFSLLTMVYISMAISHDH